MAPPYPRHPQQPVIVRQSRNTLIAYLLWLVDLFTLPGQVWRANEREAARSYGVPMTRTF